MKIPHDIAEEISVALHSAARYAKLESRSHIS